MTIPTTAVTTQLDAQHRSWNAWDHNKRWLGTRRDYHPVDVERLRGSIRIESTLADMGARQLWDMLSNGNLIRTLGALTGNQAIQMAHAGLKAIYASGWQVAADANTAGQMYPDQSLYPANSMPTLVRTLNNALRRADQIQHIEGNHDDHWIDYFLPIVADGEAGFGGPLNVFELTKALIEAGAAGIHFEDQLASAKKCGHMGGKVLVSTRAAITNLKAARLAADVMGVPTVIIARTDALSAQWIDSDDDQDDDEFRAPTRTRGGHWSYYGGMSGATLRSLAYAPYADVLWFETSKPDLTEAKNFAMAIHATYPGKFLAYNCSPSFNWQEALSKHTIAAFQSELAKMGYLFQFVTLAGFHSLNMGMYALASDYAADGMTAYVKLQQEELRAAGYHAARHQQFVGTGYFDEVLRCVSGSSTLAGLTGSTEEQQFKS